MSITRVIAAAGIAIWVIAAAGAAAARTDWKPMLIGKPEWFAPAFQYRLEIRKQGEMTKRLVSVEVEELRFEDGTIDSRYIHLPLRLQWAQDHNRVPPTPCERLIGCDKVSFLQFMQTGEATPPFYTRLVGAERWPDLQINDNDIAEHARWYFLISIHDTKRRLVKKWICLEFDSSERGHRAYLVDRVPLEKIKAGKARLKKKR